MQTLRSISSEGAMNTSHDPQYRQSSVSPESLPENDYPNAHVLEDAEIRWSFPRWMRWTLAIGMVWYLVEVLAEALPWAIKAWLK